MDYPPCFNSKEIFEAWVEVSLDDNSEEPDPRFSFCNYCTKKYQSEMKQIDMCLYPEKELVEEEDGWN